MLRAALTHSGSKASRFQEADSALDQAEHSQGSLLLHLAAMRLGGHWHWVSGKKVPPGGAKFPERRRKRGLRVVSWVDSLRRGTWVARLRAGRSGDVTNWWAGLSY